MFLIYEKKIQGAFCDGVETLVVSRNTGLILAHTRAWNDPAVIDKIWTPRFVGESIMHHDSEFTPLSGDDLENAQGWASDVVAHSPRAPRID